MKKTALLFTLLLLSFFGNTQKHTISGFISDASSGEKLIGATVFDMNSKKGTTSNLYGFFSITLPEGEVNLRVSYVGYVAVFNKITLNSNTKLNLELKDNETLKEHTVIATQSEKIQEKSQMSTVEISMEKVKALPVFLGEQDIMKTIQLLPGVQSGSEGSSGLYVRGGGPDQNLILLDGVPVYNASHLFGFFSVFNADAINSVTLIKGGFPARYGGRLSSVIDIRMKEGNLKEVHGEGSIGLISGKFSVEAPIVKDKTSFILSGRRTWIDALASPLIKSAAKSNGTNASGGYYFYDFNAKINHKLNDNNRLYLSGYFGNDKFYARIEEEDLFQGTNSTFTSKNSIQWGNIITALRWNNLINDKLFSNTTLRYSRYKFKVGFSEEEKSVTAGTTFTSFDYFSGIEDWSGSVDFDYIPTPNHYIKFGLGNTYHTFTPGVNQVQVKEAVQSLDTTFGSSKQFAHEANIYVEDDFKIGELIKINGGLHLSAFFVGKETYLNLEPRISGRYLIDETMSLKASYAKMSQYMHLLTNGSIGLPTDLWVPVTEKIKPQISHQVAAGVAKTFKKQYEISIEGYYKWMKNLIEYKEGSSLILNNNFEELLLQGNGKSYGSEFLIRKQKGKINGWIGYTLAWSTRHFDHLNNGETFWAKYDRRHNLSVVANWDITKRFTFSTIWVYSSGARFTPIRAKFLYPDASSTKIELVPVYSKRNEFSMSPTHRLDVNFVIRNNPRKRFRTEWHLGGYNIYNRATPYRINVKVDASTGEVYYEQPGLFGFIPSIAYNFRF